MKLRSIRPILFAKTASVVMSLVLCAVGVLLIARPETGVLTIGRLLGATLAVFGAARLAGFFSRDLFRLAFQYDLEFGALLLLLGLILLLRPAGAMSFLAACAGLAALVDSLFRLRVARDAREFGVKSWWVVILLAVLNAVLGLVLLFCPDTGAQLLTMLLGASLLAEGVLNLTVVLCMVKIVHNQFEE